MNGRVAEILHVEDDVADAELAGEALTRAGIVVNTHVVKNGPAALAYLRRHPPYADVPLPDLILLDLNLPGLDGHDVLAEIKHDPSLRRIPVVILTTSSAAADIVASYDLGANSYITKPARMKGWIEIVRSLDNFWFTITTLAPT